MSETTTPTLADWLAVVDSNRAELLRVQGEFGESDVSSERDAYLGALENLASAVSDQLAPRPQEGTGHRPASLLTALARVNSAEDAARASMPDGSLGSFWTSAHQQACLDLAHAVREHLAPVPEGTVRAWSVTGFTDEQDTVHATGVLAGNHDMTSASGALRGTGAWFLVVPATSPEQALEVACQAQVDALAASADDYPHVRDLGYIECDSDDGERSVGCTDEGVRVCPEHAREAARQGEGIEFDDDASQLLEDECGQLRKQAS